MIEVVEGRGVGAGKSYFACTRILAQLAAGGTVFASDTFGLNWDEAKAFVARRYGVELEEGQYRTFCEADVPRLHEVTPAGTEECPVLVVVDEAHQQLNARDWADKEKRPFFNWLTQSRHDDTDVMFISQAAANMDKQIMRLVTYYWRCRNMSNFRIPGLGRWPMRQFVVTQVDSDGRFVLGKRWLRQDPEIFRCYRSKSMKGRHKRSGEVVAKRKLRATQGRKAQWWVWLGGAVLVGLILQEAFYG